MVTIAGLIYKVRSHRRRHAARVAWQHLLEDACSAAAEVEFVNIPDDFWTDTPIGEVPPMTEVDAMVAAIQKIGVDIERDHTAVIQAAKAFRSLSLAGVDPDSDVWHVTRERLFDAVDRLPVVFDIGWPVADEETLARGIFEGGA